MAIIPLIIAYYTYYSTTFLAVQAFCRLRRFFAVCVIPIVYEKFFATM